MKVILYSLLVLTVLNLQAQFVNGTLKNGTLKITTPSSATTPTAFTDISGVVAIYDANIGATNSAGSLAVDNDKLKAWRDGSGSNYHVVTNGNACTWHGAVFGTNAGIEFGSMWAATAAISNSTIFTAVKLTSLGGFLVAVDSTNSASRQLIYKDNADKPSFYSGTVLQGGNALVVNTYYTFMATFNSSGNDFLYTNGVQCVTGDAGNQSLDGIKIGAQYDDTLQWVQYIGLVVIWNRVLNATERGQVETIATTRGWR